jgi:hypothetical protein
MGRWDKCEHDALVPDAFSRLLGIRFSIFTMIVRMLIFGMKCPECGNIIKLRFHKLHS